MANRLFIPAVGYRIRLAEPWKFKLHHEYRNSALFDALDATMKIHYRDRGEPIDVEIEAGALLEIDRVYVRAGNTSTDPNLDFDSITFKLSESRLNSKKKSVRFWVKLDDANTIVYDLPDGAPTTKAELVVEKKSSSPKKIKPSDIIAEVVAIACCDWTVARLIERDRREAIEKKAQQFLRELEPFLVEIEDRERRKIIENAKRDYAYHKGHRDYTVLSISEEDFVKERLRQCCENRQTDIFREHFVYNVGKCVSTKNDDGTRTRRWTSLASDSSVAVASVVVVTNGDDTEVISVDFELPARELEA